MTNSIIRVRKARQADYIYWLKKDYWSPPEASALLAGYEPEESPDGDIAFSELACDADGIHRLIIDSINCREIGVTNPPADWVQWAEQKRLTLPPDLMAVTREQANTPASAGKVAPTQIGGDVGATYTTDDKKFPWWQTDYDVLKLAQDAGDSLRRKNERTSNRKISDAIANRIEADERRGKGRKPPTGEHIKNTVLKGWKYKPSKAE